MDGLHFSHGSRLINLMEKVNPKTQGQLEDQLLLPNPCNEQQVKKVVPLSK
jgi:hypothetical protein